MFIVFSMTGISSVDSFDRFSPTLRPRFKVFSRLVVFNNLSFSVFVQYDTFRSPSYLSNDTNFMNKNCHYLRISELFWSRCKTRRGFTFRHNHGRRRG